MSDIKCEIHEIVEVLEENLLKQLTGWSTEMLQKEKFTYDMKVLFLSINQIIQNKEKEEKEAEKENINKEKTK